MEQTAKTLILIPCCGRKLRGGDTDYQRLRSNCITYSLSGEVGKRLLELRREVVTAFREEPGPDLGFETERRVEYMEAYLRYQGNLYSRISHDSWTKLKDNSGLRLVIVSALYGFVNHNEPIRCYNRTMKDHIYPGRLLKSWWRSQRLFDVLLDYVARNRVEAVHDFLSTDYRDALEGFSSGIRKLGLQYIPHSYSGLGSGSDYHRGEDVNRLIQSS